MLQRLVGIIHKTKKQGDIVVIKSVGATAEILEEILSLKVNVYTSVVLCVRQKHYLANMHICIQ